MVRQEGLEPSHLAALEPKSSVSTNSTTSALQSYNDLRSGAFYFIQTILQALLLRLPI